MSLKIDFSPADSARFGIRVERGSFNPQSPLAEVVDCIAASPADLLIIRVPAGRTDIALALQRAGETVIAADTLVYHGIDLTPESGEWSPSVRRATPADRPAIIDIATAGFQGYRSHYSANPLIPPALVLEGYVEWAHSRLQPQDERQSTWVVSDGQAIAGFATCDIKDGVADILLNSVHPRFERRGHYGRLLRHVMRHHADLGNHRLVISTQIWNYTVQRQWARAGLLIDCAFDTYHIDRRMQRASMHSLGEGTR
ncbi:MAG: N-acetyltransferase family protein [Stenotrophomonas geniculata]